MLVSKHALALCAAALVCATGASAKPVFVTAPATQGNIIVDQTTGDVSYCVLRTTGTSTPAGVCGKIGTATPAASNPSLVISESNVYNPPFGARVFVTNVYTGQVTQCDYNYSVTTVTGTCAAIATVP